MYREACVGWRSVFMCPMRGAFFQRTTSAGISDDYWERDTVNEQAYAVPEVQEAFKRKYERNLSRLDEQNGNGKNLLEVGCGSGIFLRVAASRGWNVFG